MPPLLTLFYLLVHLLPLFWPFPCQSTTGRNASQLQAADGRAVGLQDWVRSQVPIGCLSRLIHGKQQHFLTALQVLTDGLWPALPQHVKEISLLPAGPVPQQGALARAVVVLLSI